MDIAIHVLAIILNINVDSYVSIYIDIPNPALGFGYTREVSLDILYKWVASNFIQLIKINVFHIQFLYEYLYIIHY